MSADLYADQVANIREKLADLNAERVENYTDMANNITEAYNEKMQGYADKWKAVSETGGEELAGLLGAKGIYKGGKKIYDLYKSTKARSAAKAKAKQEQQDKDVDEDLDEDQIEGPDELPDTDEGGRKQFQDDDDLDANQDWYNDAGEKYFTGSEADHDQYYNEDGTLKDPTNVPEGHQATNEEDGDDDFDEDAIDADAPTGGLEDLGYTEEDAQALFADPPQMARAGNADAQGENLDAGADEAGDSFMADDSFTNPFGPALDPPMQPAPLQAEVGDIRTTQNFAQSRDFGDDPFQPTSGQSVSRTVVQRPAEPTKALEPDEPPEPQELTTFKSSDVDLTPPEPIRAPPQPAGAGEAGDFDSGQQIGNAFRQAGAQPEATAGADAQGGANALVGGEQSAVESGLSAGEDGASLLSRVGQKAFTSLAQRGQSIRQGFQNVKNFFKGSTASEGEAGAEAAGETAGEVAGEGGAELAGMATSDAVLGAIPVVGEVALAVSGLVAIGEGLYHLFHPEKKPPAPPPPPPLQAPTQLTQKYSMALPSADSSIDRAASVGTF